MSTPVSDRTPVDAFLGLGSNLAPRREHLGHALRRLRDFGELVGVSGVYETDPVGYEDQPRFLNLVARLRTRLGPRELLDGVRAIETERGRARTFRNAPRTLDIDILLYGDEVVEREGLTIPHPRMDTRAFVLVPLLELDPARADPRTGTPLDALEAASPPPEMDRIMDGERLLHETQD